MKYLNIIALAALFLAAACGTFRQTPEEQKKVAQIVRDRLDRREFTIDIDYMIPLRGGSKPVDSFSITLDGETLNSNLPYFGVAHNIPYGGGKGLTFKEKISDYSETASEPGKRVVVIKVKTEEDTYIYTISVFNNGTADIHVNCRERDDISYRGTLRTRDDE